MKLSDDRERSELQGTNVQRERDNHIFVQNGGYSVSYPSNILQCLLFFSWDVFLWGFYGTTLWTTICNQILLETYCIECKVWILVSMTWVIFSGTPSFSKGLYVDVMHLDQSHRAKIFNRSKLRINPKRYSLIFKLYVHYNNEYGEVFCGFSKRGDVFVCS